MHRIRGAGFRPAVLLFLVLVWVLAVLGHAAMGSGGFPGATGPVAGAGTVGIVPYLSLGMGLVRSGSGPFVDGDEGGHAALY